MDSINFIKPISIQPYLTKNLSTSSMMAIPRVPVVFNSNISWVSFFPDFNQEFESLVSIVKNSY